MNMKEKLAKEILQKTMIKIEKEIKKIDNMGREELKADLVKSKTMLFMLGMEKGISEQKIKHIENMLVEREKIIKRQAKLLNKIIKDNVDDELIKSPASKTMH